MVLPLALTRGELFRTVEGVKAVLWNKHCNRCQLISLALMLLQNNVRILIPSRIAFTDAAHPELVLRI